MRNSMVGNVYKSKRCGEFIVIEDLKWNEVHIKFLSTGTRSIVPRSSVLSGQVRDLNMRTAFGVGFSGQGEYRCGRQEWMTCCYAVWYQMLKRCYGKDAKSGKVCYNDVTVCEEWHNFQNFAEWYKRHYIEGFHIDKDLILFGNQIYSPEFCSFVPNEINSFCPRYNLERNMPPGVKKRKEKYLTEVYVGGKSVYSKTFSTQEEAFEMYCIVKSQRARDLAIEWKDSLHSSVYENLLNFDTKLYLSK